MKLRVLSGLLTAFFAVCAGGYAEETLLVLSKADQTLSMVDPATMKVIAKMPSGPDPHEVTASADGKLAFISNYGGGAYNTISIIDLVEHKALPAVDLGPLRGPHGLVFAGGKVWFTAEAAKVIGSYDPVAKKVDWILGTGQNRTHMVYVFDDLKRLVTSNVSSATMTMIEKSAGSGPGRGPGGQPPPGANGRGPGGPGRGPGGPREDWDETVIPVGRGAEGFDVSPDGKEIWAANAGDGTISIVNVASKKVSETLSGANVNGANRLKFTPDGKLVFVSMLGGPDVAIFDVASRKEVKRIPVGRGAAGIQMQPDGARVFVACTPNDYVAIIDLKSMNVTGHLDAGEAAGRHGLGEALKAARRKPADQKTLGPVGAIKQGGPVARRAFEKLHAQDPGIEEAMRRYGRRERHLNLWPGRQAQPCLVRPYSELSALEARPVTQIL